VLGGIKIKIALADCLGGVAEPKSLGERRIDAQKTALSILEVDAIRDILHEGAQQLALLRHGFLRLFMLGNVDDRPGNQGVFSLRGLDQADIPQCPDGGLILVTEADTDTAQGLPMGKAGFDQAGFDNFQIRRIVELNTFPPFRKRGN